MGLYSKLSDVVYMHTTINLTSEIDKPMCFSLIFSYDFTSQLKQSEAAGITFSSALRPRDKIFITWQLK